MKHLIARGLAALALLAVAGTASATYCSLESPQFCPQQATTPSTSGATTGPSSAGATAGAAAGATAAGQGTGSASITSNADGSLSIGLPPGVRAAALPAIRCRGTSSASGWGWNFLSFSGSDTDRDGVCQAADLAAILIAQCQHLTAHTVLSGALGKAYPGASFPIPPDAKNSPTGRCELPAPPPIVKPDPLPTPVPPVEKKIPPPPERERVTLKAGALFATDKADLTPEGMIELARLARRLGDADVQAVRVIGHTDNTASAAYNEGLSLRRAQAVRAYLILRGVDDNVITAEGRGLREPIADNRTADGRAQNRRVTVDITAAAIRPAL